MMRSVLLVSLLALSAFAGCLAEDGIDTPPPTTEETDEVDLDTFLEGHPEFCESEESCRFWDQDYHQYVVYDLDTVVFDVVILPPTGMSTPDQIATSRQAVQAWHDGIMAYAEPWLAEAFEMNIYAVGIDVPSLDAVEDPEMVVISNSAVGIFGIGLEPAQFGCIIIGEMTREELGGHEHAGNRIWAENCTGTGFTCFAINVGGLSPRGLYDLIAHEVGHCLGAGHVGDALDFRARYAPVEDIMSYQNNETHVHCVSNLDVLTLQGVYAPLLGRAAEEHLPRGSYLAQDPRSWEAMDCENPPGM